MVTEIQPSDGDGIPAPTFEVYSSFLPDPEFFKSKVDQCVRDYKDGNQSIYLTNTSTGLSCIHSLEDYKTPPVDMSFGKNPWKRVFDLYNGWFYIRYGSVDMKEALQSHAQHLMVFSPNTSLRYQIMLHDNNEYPFGDVYTMINELQAESKTIYIKIKKTTLERNCEKSSSYSYRKCAENFLVQVSFKMFCT